MSDEATPVRPDDPELISVPKRSWRFWLTVLIICLAGGLVRLFILSEYLEENPFARVPRSDAHVYWDWAGRIADGQWQQTTPFLSAPLYPYVLAIIQACAGGLTAAYVFQIVLSVCTAGLLAWIGRARFGDAIGLLSAVLFLLAFEPASFAQRTLAASLQLLLIGLIWIALIRFQQSRSVLRAVFCGIVLGVNCLATPSMLLLVPAVGLWVFLIAGRTSRAVYLAGLTVAGAVLAISPATVHNWRAGGEFIPISAHAGITLYQGNGPGATGGYSAVQGISPNRGRMHKDTAELYQRETGRSGTWSEIDRYFLRKTWQHWYDNPVGTLILMSRKAYYFLSARNYGDIYNPELEVAAGLSDRLNLAPLRTAWLLPPALVAVIMFLRRIRTYGPELLLFGLPLLVVVLFFYSPRYRVAAVPIIVVAAAWTLGRVVRWKEQRLWSVAGVVSLLLALGFGPLNQILGFDSIGKTEDQFECNLGIVYVTDGKPDLAIPHFRQALRLNPDYPKAKIRLSNILRQRGELGEATALLRDVVRLQPNLAEARNSLGICLAKQDRVEDAQRHLEYAVRLEPDFIQAHSNLGNVLTQRGEFLRAEEHYRTALRLAPNDGVTWFNMGNVLIAQEKVEEAIKAYRQALRIDPNLTQVRPLLGRVLIRRHQYAEAANLLREAHQTDPADLLIVNDLAWLLATCPRAEVRNGHEAVRLATHVCQATNHQDSNLLDTLAAAHAEAGQFDKAVAVARQAVDQATVQGNDVLAQEIRQRLQLYTSRQPYHDMLQP